MATIESEPYLSSQENDLEYFKNKIIDMYYTSIRPCVKHESNENAKTYGELLCSLNPHKNLLKMLYKLIAQTRDICYGKGERDITYMMIYQWWKILSSIGTNCIIFYDVLLRLLL